MNKYDADKLLVDNDIQYPKEADDERSVQKRCHVKKSVFYLTPKQKLR